VLLKIDENHGFVGIFFVGMGNVASVLVIEKVWSIRAMSNDGFRCQSFDSLQKGVQSDIARLK
jgi:hypothetical protein